MSCGVGLRHGSDPTLLWFWHRPAATALIRPLAWEPPFAMGAALEKAKWQKKKKDKEKRNPKYIWLNSIIKVSFSSHICEMSHQNYWNDSVLHSYSRILVSFNVIPPFARVLHTLPFSKIVSGMYKLQISGKRETKLKAEIFS